MGGYVYFYIGNSRNFRSNWDAEILQQHKQLMSKVAEHDPWTYRVFHVVIRYKCTLGKIIATVNKWNEFVSFES